MTTTGVETTGTKSNSSATGSDRGWICPRCGTVWAPWIRSCNCGGNWYPPYYWPPWWNDYRITCDTTVPNDKIEINASDIYQTFKDAGDLTAQLNDVMRQHMAAQSKSVPN